MTAPRPRGRALSAFVALAASTALAAFPASGQVAYVVQPVRTDSLIHLRVEMEFRGEADGATRLSLPRDRFGVSEMRRWVRGLEVEGSAELHAIEPGLYEVRGEPGSEIRISYEVVYDPEAAGFIAFGPSVGPEHFHFFGSQWMARLQPHEGPRDIEVRLRRGDGAEALGSSYGIGPGPHRVRADDYDLDYSVIAGGSYRTATAECRGRPVHTMIHGDFEVPDSTIFSLIPRIVCGQRELFEDFDRPFFTVFVTGRDHLVAGAPVLHGFTAFLEAETEEAELRHLLAHEMIHTWFPRTARLVEPERPDAPEARTRWFHEGFTEYLSRIALVSQGLESRAWRVERTNEDLERLAYHPYATATLDELEEAMRNDRYSNSHHRLHYRRGALLALNWDRRIRHRSGGARTLLDPLREVLREASGGAIGLDRFGAILAGYGSDALADVRRHLESRRPLTVEEEAYGPDYALGSRRLPSFDPGFDVAATLRTGAVTGLREDGPAARAGLEEGLEVVDLENAAPWLGTNIPPPRIGRWNPDQPTVVVVDADGQRRRFSFSARGPDRDVPTFLPSSSLSVRSGARR